MSACCHNCLYWNPEPPLAGDEFPGLGACHAAERVLTIPDFVCADHQDAEDLAPVPIEADASYRLRVLAAIDGRSLADRAEAVLEGGSRLDALGDRYNVARRRGRAVA